MRRPLTWKATALAVDKTKMAESPKPERFKDWLALKTVDHFLRGTQEVGYDTRVNSGSRGKKPTV